MQQINESLPEDKKELYALLNKQLIALIGDEKDVIANMANFTSLLYHSLKDINWLGFYLYKGGELVLGPFQGKPACIRIVIGQGVCGLAAKKQETIVVNNVHEFEGHITCDVASNSEIVIPIVYKKKIYGVLDIDSPSFTRFDDDDKAGLEQMVVTL
ncbi:MAG: GAF domain-containing protein, partial [Calditrichaceae bacterium]